MINLNKLEFPISLVSYGMLRIYNHHCKLKSWSIWTNWNFLYLWSPMECYVFTIIIANKKVDQFEQIGISYIFGPLWNVTYLQSSLLTKTLINLNELEFYICLSSYGMLLIYSHHCKQKNWLIWTNWNFLYLWSVVECYLFTIIITN